MEGTTCQNMETKLCRLCARPGVDFQHIFKTEGLKEKIETCLPIVVSQFCLLPDTICRECTENINSFYDFTKRCLEKIIILESQYNILDSCLKSKQKKDKGCLTDIRQNTRNKSLQTDDILDVLGGNNCDLQKYSSNFPLMVKFLENKRMDFAQRTDGCLVDYDIDSDSCAEDNDGNGKVLLGEKLNTIKEINQYVDLVTSTPRTRHINEAEKNLIGEITQRKIMKRKNNFIETSQTKIFKMDCSNRRKSKMPKKLESLVNENDNDTVMIENIPIMNDSFKDVGNDAIIKSANSDADIGELQSNLMLQTDKNLTSLPQSCLLCEAQFAGTVTLAAHVFEAHGIDMTEIMSSCSVESVPEKNKKRIPNLLKISDLKKNDCNDDNTSQELPEQNHMEGPPTLLPTFACPNCSEVCTTKSDLMIHLKIRHAQQAAHVCGICFQQCTSSTNLKNHLDSCLLQHKLITRYICQVCHFGDDNFKLLENHVLTHECLIENCKKEFRMFDPADYITTNDSYENGISSPIPSKSLTCDECGLSTFETFKEFSSHRRSHHSIFHCDLCNKFYGRNSHLWKHVNRLHKGHPSITCQICYKTSASKYHLAQHFNKIHQTKGGKPKTTHPQLDSLVLSEKEQFLNQKFQSFDFQSVKQKFMRQDIVAVEQEQRSNVSDNEDTSNNMSDVDEEFSLEHHIKEQTKEEEPKEIDSSHDLYTNIITNYTPPLNEGEFKCPKCSKAFHKKMLLKKHKKNCRPKLQKDLLTRCKSCARVFKDRQSLAKHLVNYHSEYVCEICSQKVQSKCEIVSHIRFQHPGCHLVCELCTNILRSQDDLQEHLRNHSDSYICQFCGDPLPSKIKLKMHILSLHRKILSLSCGICLKLFENQHVLRNHVSLVHKDQLTPLTSCPVCGKNYGSKWKTYDHLNKSHGRIFRACKTCLEVFNNDAQLQAHCDVTGHGGQGSAMNNAAASTLRNSIMAISTAIKDVVENDGGQEDVTDSGEDNEDDSDRSADDDEGEDEPVEEEDDQKLFLDSKQLSQLHSSKISLLEKRLIGKKTTEQDHNPNNIKSTKHVTTNKKRPTNDIQRDKHLIKEEVDQNSPLMNSSKRTVYVNSNDPSYCEICFKTWPAKKHLWQHYIRCHKTVAATVCGICLKTNESYDTLQKHLQENHPTLLHGQGFGSNFICRICGRYHNASSKLRLHMVIHENFDWSMIENVPNNNTLKIKEEKSMNGFNQRKQQSRNDESSYTENDIINYDSLIEQVECSSQSENEESDEQLKVKDAQASSGSEDEGDSDDDSVISGNSMKARMLRNILSEKEEAQKNDDEDDEDNNSISSSEDSDTSFSDGSKSGASSDVEVEEEASNESLSSSQRKFNNGGGASDTVDSLIINSNIFKREPEELDSAIKSISFDCIKKEDLKVEDDFCELQNNCLNENEIESAVGSIL